MDTSKLIKSVEINGIEYAIDSDFRNIITIMKIMQDPDLMTAEQVSVALEYFYTDEIPEDMQQAIFTMYQFIDCAADSSDVDTAPAQNSKTLYSWEQDFNIIIAPINKILGKDVRGEDYLHWWTFLAAFMEIGECTFSTYISIRNKQNKGIKLDKAEQKIYKDNKKSIDLKIKHDSVTQSILDAITGGGI